MSACNSILRTFVKHFSAWAADWTCTFLYTMGIGIASIALSSTIFLSHPRWEGNVYEPRGFPIISTWSFFKERHDFVQKIFGDSDASMFRIRMPQYSVTVLRGESARKPFFTNRTLDITQGYAILFACAPVMDSLFSKSSEKERLFVRHIVGLWHRDTIIDALPSLLDGLHARMNEWGFEGCLYPFKNVYELVFPMFVRMSTCREFADDREAIAKIAAYYSDIESSATPFAFHFPWFPGSAMMRKARAISGVYRKLSHYIKLRRNSVTSTTDPIDTLISGGVSDEDIIQILMIVLTTGLTDTSIIPCWVLMHLSVHPKWKAKALAEFRSLSAKYTNTLSLEPLHKRLASIPLDAWETELPLVDLIIRETVRINTNLTPLRRNRGKDIDLNGATIKRGDFVAYPLHSVHMNPEIYTDPMTFDPERFAEGREEDKKQTFGFMGWGAGRHLCPGMRISKVMMKLVLSVILLGYELELVDEFGNYAKAVPQQDRNNIHHAGPLGEPLYLKFKRIKE